MQTPGRNVVTAEATYGSDQAGMVCAYAFADGGPGRAVDFHEAAVMLAAPRERAEFLWLHFSLANAAAGRWLRLHAQLPESFFDVHHSSSTRLEVIDDALMGVLNDVQFFGTDPSSASTMALHASPGLLITARATALRSVDRLRAAVKNGEAFASPADLLAHLLRDQADVLVAIVRDAGTQVDSIEDRIISGQRSNRAHLGMIRRVLVRRQRVLAPEPAALFRLLSRPPSWLSERDLAELRNSAEELSAAVADSVALGERVRMLQEELTALLSERTNQTLFILTVVTVLALPLTIIPGLFGMNVGGVPFAGSPAGFWFVVLVVAVIVTAGAMLAARFHRNRR